MSILARINNSMAHQSKQGIQTWLILIGLVFVWGSSFILIKKSLLYFSDIEVGLLRITITFLFLLPMAIKRIGKINKKYIFLLTISGIIGSVIPALLFAIAETGIDSSLAGTLNSLTPLFTLIIGISFFKIHTRWFNVLGLLIGLTGALGLIWVSADDQFSVNMIYSSLVVIASICYAINVNLVKTYFHEINSVDITVLTFFFVGIPTFLYVLFFTKIPTALIHDSTVWEGIGYLSILSIVGTGLALIAFNKLIKLSSPIFASSVTYLIPIVAILWGVSDGETFKVSFFVWILLILIGVFLVNAKPYSRLNLSSRILFWKK